MERDKTSTYDFANYHGSVGAQMNNKMIIKAVKVGLILVLILSFIYGTMKAGFAAYNYGYHLAVESLSESTGE